MQGLGVLFYKEFSGYFRSPMAYIFGVVFLLVVNGLYMNTFFLARVCDMRAFFEPFPVILLVFASALTMRLWAEERKSGTLGLLLSFPASPWALILGKFLGTYLFALIVLSGTLVIPIMLAVLGDPDEGALFSAYLGAALMLAFYLALGAFLSALFEDQITAFILTLVTGLVSILLGTNLVSSSIEGWLPGLGAFLREALGLLPHFNPFVKGVVPLRDVVFFLIYTGVFLTLNYFTIFGFLRYFRRRLFYPLTLVLLGLALVSNALLGQIRLPRFDFTEERLYTISPVSKKVLARLKAPVQVTYYVSSPQSLPPPMRNLALEVRALLEEFAAFSPQFKFAVVDPTRNPELVSRLRSRGIEPFAVQIIERDKVSVRRVYSALALSYLDKPEEVIPQVVPESLSTLEYDLVSRIYKLSLSEKPVVALYTGRNFLAGTYHSAEEILHSLGFEVKNTPIDKNQSIPEKARLLVLLAPGKLNQRQLYEIGAFLHRGGSVLLAHSAAVYSYNPGPEGEILATPILQDLSVNKWLKAYGLEIEKKTLFDFQSVTMSLSQEREMGIFKALVRIPVNFPMQAQVLAPQMNQKLPIMHGLSALLYLWGSPLKLEEKVLESKGLKVRVLFTSTSHAWAEEVQLSSFSEKDLRPPEEVSRWPLAVLVEGRFPLPFEGKVPPWPGEEDSPEEDSPQNKEDKKRKASEERKEKEKKEKTQKEGAREGAEPEEAKPGKLMVVGSGAMFADGIIDIFDNALFWANAVEALSLGGDLLSLRAKLKPVRYIGEVSPSAKLLWKTAVVFGPALLWVLLGVTVFIRRRSRRRRFEKGESL